MNRVEQIRQCLEERFAPLSLEVVDESHKHIGHPGAKDGRGHFVAEIVSSEFAGKTMLQRHRMVYEAVGTLMQTDIHALNIDAKTPEEA